MHQRSGSVGDKLIGRTKSLHKRPARLPNVVLRLLVKRVSVRIGGGVVSASSRVAVVSSTRIVIISTTTVIVGTAVTTR